jgi:DNA-binding MarR family transcriptional regulator
MDFIRSIVNDSEIVTDAEAEKFLEDLKILDEPRYTALEWAMMEGGNDLTDAIDAIQIDEDAFDRIAKRVEKRDLINYRLIIGAENLMKARLFLELAKEGKNIPSVYVKGMQPAIEMLDDIVTAGPGFVQLLRVLHKRAQKKQ